MRSIETALLVDFARRGKVVIPLVLLVMLALPLWLFIALGYDGAIDPNAREAVALHVTLTLVLGFGAAVAVIQAQGRLARFFLRPISVTRLVACQMALGMATVSVLYLCAAALLNLKGVNWPLLGPALFIATTLACALAAMWTFEGTVAGQLVACTTVTVPLVIWFNRCYGAKIMGDWQVMWHNPTALEAISLAGISATAYLVAVIGVTRVRRGDVCDFASLQAWWERFWSRPNRAMAFRDPLAAQRWCLWEETFGIAPASLVAFFAVLLASLRLAGLVETRWMLEAMVVASIVFLTVILPMVFSLLMGNCGQSNVQSGMRHLLATRPVTDSFLAAAILRNCARVLTWAWGTWLIALCVVAGLSWLAGSYDDVVQTLFPPVSPSESKVLTYLVLPLISWTLTTLLTTLVAAGRPWLIVAFLFGAFGLGIGMAYLGEILTPQAFAILVKAWLALSGTIYLAGTLLAYVVALRRKFITTTVVVAAVATWATVSLVAAAMYFDSTHERTILIWHGVGALALAIFPFAGLPLAMRWNRHR